MLAKVWILRPDLFCLIGACVGYLLYFHLESQYGTCGGMVHLSGRVRCPRLLQIGLNALGNEEGTNSEL